MDPEDRRDIIARLASDRVLNQGGSLGGIEPARQARIFSASVRACGGFGAALAGSDNQGANSSRLSRYTYPSPALRYRRYRPQERAKVEVCPHVEDDDEKRYRAEEARGVYGQPASTVGTDQGRG